MTREELREWRKARGWLQARLAQETGFSQRVIVQYEGGERPIPHSFMLALEALDLRDLITETQNWPDDLLHGAGMIRARTEAHA